MKVLFLTNIPSPYRVEFFNELGKLCDLTVLYELESASDRDSKWKSSDAKYFKEIFLNGKRVRTDASLSLSIIKYLNDNSYNIIVVGGYSTPTAMIAIQYLKLTNKFFVLSTDGGLIKDDNRITYRIKKHFISSASAWLSTGKNTTEYLVNYGAKEKEIFIYPFTSVKEEDIIKEKIEDKLKVNIRKELSIKEERVILSVGQFIYRKGFDVLINSMKQLPKDCGVYIIGGEPTEEYIKLKEELSLDNLYFIGFKSKEELKKYYEVADLFVLPTREDIWGLVINEAMAMGLPIITTDKCVAGLELIKNDLNGYIVPINNEYELAKKINKIIEDKKIIDEMSLNNLVEIRSYSIEKMAERHIEIFNELTRRM